MVVLNGANEYDDDDDDGIRAKRSEGGKEKAHNKRIYTYICVTCVCVYI